MPDFAGCSPSVVCRSSAVAAVLAPVPAGGMAGFPAALADLKNK